MPGLLGFWTRYYTAVNLEVFRAASAKKGVG